MLDGDQDMRINVDHEGVGAELSALKGLTREACPRSSYPGSIKCLSSMELQHSDPDGIDCVLIHGHWWAATVSRDLGAVAWTPVQRTHRKQGIFSTVSMAISNKLGSISIVHPDETTGNVVEHKRQLLLILFLSLQDDCYYSTYGLLNWYRHTVSLSNMTNSHSQKLDGSGIHFSHHSPKQTRRAPGQCGTWAEQD